MDLHLLPGTKSSTVNQIAAKLEVHPSHVYKHCPPYVQRGKRAEDLCGHCERLGAYHREAVTTCNKLLKTDLKCLPEMSGQRAQVDDGKKAVELLQSAMDQKKIPGPRKQEIQNLLDSVAIFDWHVHLKDRQQSCFEHEKANLQRHQLLIRFDFCSNLELTDARVDHVSHFYKTKISLLGAAIWIKGREKPFFVDVFSDDTKHDCRHAASQVAAIILRLQEHPNLKKVMSYVHEISFWFDCGRHFLANEFFFLVTRGEPFAKRYDIVLNLFAEHHGKGECDAHFNVVGRKIDNAGYKEKWTEDNWVSRTTEVLTGSDDLDDDPILIFNPPMLKKNAKTFAIADITCMACIYTQGMGPGKRLFWLAYSDLRATHIGEAVPHALVDKEPPKSNANADRKTRWTRSETNKLKKQLVRRKRFADLNLENLIKKKEIRPRAGTM